MPRSDQVLRQWRLWRVLSATRSPLSILELATKLGVEEAPARTLRRDLEVLRELGVPLRKVREGREVRYAILDDGPPLRLDGDVALALHMALELLRPFEGTPIGESLEHLVRRLESDVGAAVRAHFDSLVRGLVVKPAAAPSYAGSAEVLATVQEALRRHVEVRLDYESADSARSWRTVEPRALVHAARGLYLLALDKKAGAPRTFRIERILAAVIGTREVAESGFDVEEYLRGGVGIFSPEHEARRFVIRVFSERAARILGENPWHESQRLTREGESWRLELELRSGRELVSRVLALGG